MASKLLVVNAQNRVCNNFIDIFEGLERLSIDFGASTSSLISSRDFNYVCDAPNVCGQFEVFQLPTTLSSHNVVWDLIYHSTPEMEAPHREEDSKSNFASSFLKSFPTVAATSQNKQQISFLNPENIQMNTNNRV